MLTASQIDVLKSFFDAATVSGHIFPDAAACEAVVETGWGTSELYVKYRNIFGQKQSTVPIFQTVNLPTREFINNRWVEQTANFINFPTAAEAFEARMNLLIRLAPTYRAYNNALHSTTPEDFLTYVSRAWSTDPKRAQTCIEILHAHRDILTAPSTEPLETA